MRELQPTNTISSLHSYQNGIMVRVSRDITHPRVVVHRVHHGLKIAFGITNDRELRRSIEDGKFWPDGGGSTFKDTWYASILLTSSFIIFNIP
jgi:hypothetical protein